MLDTRVPQIRINGIILVMGLYGSPTMSVTCTLKFAYSSLCVDGTITVDLKSRPSMIVVAFNPDSRIET